MQSVLHEDGFTDRLCDQNVWGPLVFRALCLESDLDPGSFFCPLTPCITLDLLFSLFGSQSPHLQIEGKTIS